VTYAVLVACGVAVLVVLRFYGGDTFIPEAVGGFAASLGAFMLALAWERDREQEKVTAAATELAKSRVTEARRRLPAVRKELEANAKSLDELAEVFKTPIRPGTFPIANPQLLDRAWNANAARLTELIADYELTGSLAFTYGRIEELRWRLRLRTEHRDASLDRMTAPLVGELQQEVGNLLEDVVTQIKDPQVQPYGLIHVAQGTLLATATVTATLEATRIPREPDSRS
jgi:hypothetical protein